MSDELAGESGQGSVLQGRVWTCSRVCERSGSSQKNLRGKTDGILKESELIMLADSLGKCSLTTDFFLNWRLLVVFHSNLKNLPKEEYDDE